MNLGKLPARLFIVVLVPFLCAELVVSIHMTLARGALPFADNGWADHAQIFALNRMAHGGPAYTAPIDRDSYIYGPLYLWTLNGIRGLLGLPPAIVVLRTISMLAGMLTLVPLVAVTALLAPLAGIEPRSRFAYGLALAATIAIGVCTITHNLTYDTLHPDALLFLIAGTSLALYFALARGLISEWWLAAFVPLSVLAFLTKANAVAFAAILVLSLLVARRISARSAAFSLAAIALATAAAFALLPPDVKAWTVFIPSSEPLLVSRGYQIIIDLFSSRDGVFVFFAGAMLFTSAVCAYAIAEKTGKKWSILVAGAILAALATSAPAYLKQGGTWNNLILIALCCVPFTGICVALPFRKPENGTLPGGVAFVNAFALTAMLLSFALNNKQIPTQADLAHLRGARDYAVRLCHEHPSDKVYTTLFSDLFFACPNLVYHNQIALGDLSWAEPKYTLGVPVDADPGTRYVAYIDSPRFGTPGWLAQNYRPIWSTPIIAGEWFTAYDHVPFVFYERKPNR